MEDKERANSGQGGLRGTPVQNDQRNRRRAPKGAFTEVFQEQGKVPPQALDLEEAVLGAMMLENDRLAEVIEVLKPEAFYKEAHQQIFSAIQQLFANNQPVDILTVT